MIALAIPALQAARPGPRSRIAVNAGAILIREGRASFPPKEEWQKSSPIRL